MAWINKIPSAWTGHRKFAEWLVKTMKPITIVDLGVDYGFSTMCFANAVKQWQPTAKVYGIDAFAGDSMTGYRNTKASVDQLVASNGLSANVEIIQSDFTVAASTWTLPIDILHIDGLHTKAAVTNDFNNWKPFVKNDGIMLFHDVMVKDFQVHNFFAEVTGYEKLYFVESAGLGVLTLNPTLHRQITSNWKTIQRGNVKF